MIHERPVAILGSPPWLTPVRCFPLAGALTYWLGYRFFTAGTMTLGTVYLIFFYTDALLRPVIQITRQIEDLQKAGAGIARVRQLYAIRPSLADGDRELPHGALGVEFDGVSFFYDDKAPPTTHHRPPTADKLLPEEVLAGDIED